MATTAKYIRVSTVEQNPDRQLSLEYRNYVDKISGRTNFADRPQAKKLMADILDGDVNKVLVHSINRLGRNTVDVLNTINWFTEQGVPVTSEKEGFTTLDKNGKENPTSKMVISIMATLAEWENDLRAEAQKEGIAKKKAMGGYKGIGGRPSDTDEKFLQKDKNKTVLRYLKQDKSIRETAKLASAATKTVLKVKRIAIEKGLLNPNKSNPNHDKLNRYLGDI